MSTENTTLEVINKARNLWYDEDRPRLSAETESCMSAALGLARILATKAREDTNDPLTLEELKGMNGHPVWLFDSPNGWRCFVVNWAYPTVHGDTVISTPCGVDMLGRPTSLSLLVECGLYRHPEEEFLAAINHPESITHAPRLTESELAICKSTGAKWVTRDECDDDEYVDLRDEKPELFVDGCYSGVRCIIGRVQASLMPSVHPGDCFYAGETQE